MDMIEFSLGSWEIGLTVSFWYVRDRWEGRVRYDQAGNTAACNGGAVQATDLRLWAPDSHGLHNSAVVHITWRPGLSPDESAFPINHGHENNWIQVLIILIVSLARSIRKTLNWYMATIYCPKRKRHLKVHHFLDLCGSSGEKGRHFPNWITGIKKVDTVVVGRGVHNPD